MRKLIQFVDGWILSKVEYASHKLQLVTGWDCFLQHRACYILAAGFQLLQILTTGRLPLRFAIPMAAVFLLAAYSYVCLATRPSWTEDWDRSRRERGFSNSNKADPALQRLRVAMVCFNLLVWTTVGWRTDFVLVWVSLAIYLRSCDPLPPCRGKVRDWLDTAKLVPIPVRPTEYSLPNRRLSMEAV